MTQASPPYVIGVMQTRVDARDASEFRSLVEAATSAMEQMLGSEIKVRVDVFEFVGPHLTPTGGGYSPLDFLQLGLSEKLERGIDFLLVVTEVDLSASMRPFVVALPSRLTNIGVISTKRLSPEFWGHDPDPDVTARRLAALMLHTLGHLLGLQHHPDTANVMYDFPTIEQLGEMTSLTAEQKEVVRHNMPIEARDAVSSGGIWQFAVRQTLANSRGIGQAVLRANPLRLIIRLPTMITAALSVIVVLFFSAEVWDVGSTVVLWQIALFTLIALVVGTLVLYRSVTLGAVLQRDRRLAELTVVTEATTVLSLLLTLILLAASFFGLMYFAAITVFPRVLMETWPTAGTAANTAAQIKVAAFLAAMGLLAGSLGGRADRKDLIRHILFLDEET